MTSNQVAYRQAQEAERANRQKENENYRSNRRKEDLESSKQAETARANREKERLTKWDIAMRGITGAAKAGTDMAKTALMANDPSWYNLTSNQVRDAASIPYTTPLRGPVNINGSKEDRAICLLLEFIPSFGLDDRLGAQLDNVGQVAAQNIYAWVRHANSGSRNYEPNDLIMYLLAMDSAYTLYAFGRQIYRMAMSADGENLNFVQGWAAAANVQIEQFRSKLADFRWYLDVVRTRLNSLYVPADFPYYNRHVWMVSNLFKDHPTNRSAFYGFIPKSYGVYNAMKGQINFSALGKRGAAIIDFDVYKQAMDVVINGLFNSEDIGIISGDILKAYGDRLFTIEETPINDYAEPFYSEEVLTQINGATIVGPPNDDQFDFFQLPNNQASVYQGLAKVSTGDPVPGIIIPTSGMASTGAVSIDSWILNMYKDNPTPDDNMVASRLVTLTSATSTKYTVSVAGSEIITVGYLAYVNTAGNIATLSVYDGLSEPNSWLTQILLFMQLDWAPILMFTTPNESGTIARYYMQDLANYAVISTENVANMHATAMLSLLHIPEKGLRKG